MGTVGRLHVLLHYHQDQLIKEYTGCRSLEALHKYKRTGLDQQYDVSMALPPVAEIGKNEGKENVPGTVDVDDDFVPL